MTVPSSFRKYPLAWANVAFILIVYAVFIGIAVSMHRPITVHDVTAIWPLHLILAINIAAVLGFLKAKK